MYLNIIKVIYDKHTANTLHGKNLKIFLLRSTTRPYYILFKIILKVLPRVIRQGKNRQRHVSWKGSETVTICNWHNIIYKKNLNIHLKKLLELIDEFGKVERYKINTQKSVAFLCTNNKLPEREIKKTVQFTVTSK